ncbi:hypothetical protein F5Y12DRAFT_770075 [Xylaria sp. FL1777]|nr:hypothetical protein F5Y12DRAFT_770075 [Xylaria sp. FL1777]
MDVPYIMSYNSDSDHSDDDIATLSITEAEIQRKTEAHKPTKRIEFSSEKERQQKLAKSKSPTELTIAHAKHSSSRTLKLSERLKNNLYNDPHRGRDDDDNTDYCPSPVGSSLVGHTGHSTDELVRDTPARVADGHRLRGFTRLLSA